MKRALLLLTLTALLPIGCISTPTPDIEATVQARIAATQAAKLAVQARAAATRAAQATSRALSTTYLQGTVVDSPGRNPLPDRVVVLFLNGEEVKRDVSVASYGDFKLALEDVYGFYQRYVAEFGTDEQGVLNLGRMLEGETRYLFVEDSANTSELEELVVMVMPGHSSTISPERLTLGRGEIQARQTLIDQVRFWTQVDSQPWLETYTGLFGGQRTRTYQVRYYLTYLSPQLIEAAVRYKAAREGLSAEETGQLADEVRSRLRQRNAIPFLLRIAANSPDLSLQMQPFSENVFLQNTRGDRFSPAEYDRVFDYAYRLDTVEEGYIFFPRTHEAVTTVELSNDPSIFVRVEQATLSKSQYSPRTGSVSWRFDLVPIDFPLEDLAKMPPPQKQNEAEVSLGDILGIIDLIFTVLTIFLP